jgi:hypothetical protein
MVRSSTRDGATAQIGISRCHTILAFLVLCKPSDSMGSAVFFSPLTGQLFLQRLNNLQALCSESNGKDQLPSSLLFVPGTDGRHNKGSFSIMKYLFLGSIGKDISEANLDEQYECLVEIVLLIEASSVSIFWRWDSDSLPSSHSSPSHEAKKAVAPLLSQYPYLIEYCATKEDGEMSRLPHPCKVNRKCEDTKRMLLESVPSAGVGSSVCQSL